MSFQRGNPHNTNKFKMFLSSICSSFSSQEELSQKSNKKGKYKNNKIPRLTFSLDRVLVKLSRKNIAEKELMHDQVLTFHIEKHIADRLKELDIVAFSGQFSEFFTEKVPFSFRMKTSMEEVYQSESDYIVSTSKQPAKFRSKVVDAIVLQLFYGNRQKQSNLKFQTLQAGLQRQQNLNSISDADQIQQVLRHYHKKINNFMFICNKHLTIQQVHNLFIIFKELYLFEFQKVKMFEKTVCVIIYVSTNPKFLKIDNWALTQFFIQKFQALNVFKSVPIVKNVTPQKKKQIQGRIQKMSLIEREQAKYRKNLKKTFIDIQLADKARFQEMIKNLVQLNLHKDISICLGTLMATSDQSKNIIHCFLDMLYERAPASRQIIELYQKGKIYQELEYKSFGDTPMFDAQFSESNNFSKHTALFRTKGSQQLSNSQFQIKNLESVQDLDLAQNLKN